MSDECALFLVSTPLHLMVSLAIVGYEKRRNAHILFIDQDERVNNVYRHKLLAWSDNPFVSSQVFFRPAKNLSKLTSRKQTFAEIQRIVEELKPAHIFTGNDRRIEFQYAMHSASATHEVKGYYMDEGAFTYVGREASNSFSDRVLDNALKKIFYGRWWRHPPTVGASTWINAIYASLPEHVHDLLKSKPSVKLDMQYWQTPLLIQFCQLLLEDSVNTEMLQSVDVLISLPHESLLISEGFDKTLLLHEIQSWQAKGRKVFAKYHPRDTQADVLGLAENGVGLLPAVIPMEAMLPVLPDNLCLIGDFSTTLITTKLLKPSSAVYVLPQKSTRLKAYQSVYQALGIEFL